MTRLARPLMYLGVVASVFGLAKVHAALIADPPYDFTGSYRFAWSFAYAAALCLASYGTGLPDLPRTGRQAASSAVLAPLSAALAFSAVQLATGDALLPRFVVFGSAGVSAVWGYACSVLARGGRVRSELRDRVLLIADVPEAMTLRDDLADQPERPAVLVDHMTPAQAQPQGPRSRPLCELALSMKATVIVLDRAAATDPAVVAQSASLHESGLRVRTLSGFYEEWLGKLPVSELERASLLFDIREIHGPRYLRVKRVLDVAVGLAGAVVLVAVLPFVVIGDLVANRGPLLYRQERIGKNGRVMQMVKLRTMRPGAGGLANEWTQEDDPRITPFGRVMRRTHVDELPQVINILRGDLSIVGPRPEQPRYVQELVAKLPFYDLRHLVRPGLTGWAQVKYGYAGDERDALEKLQYEFWYLRNQSLSLDVRIIGRTLRSILRGRGR